ncbi:hypothetical protein P7K49_022656 [Saguinus oedipus]|uniref:Uncharacterized protein n=1 Tax=Saguinus oedipus TaxID=9490 RepID=A0ABQ9UJF2_SAGOE|nr:hypothetical protein P7K49_022656 [Saguinus oedipus]
MASPFSGALQLTDLNDFIGPSQVALGALSRSLARDLRHCGPHLTNRETEAREGGVPRPTPVPPGVRGSRARAAPIPP